MSYADQLMSTGEQIRYRQKQHWFIFVWGARFTILAIILAGIIGFLTAGMGQGTARDVFTWIVAILFIGGLLVLAWTILQYLSHEYVITSHRVLQVFGVLNKTSMDSSLEKINDAKLTQSIFGRMFGFGDLDILTASDTGVDQFRMIRNPIEFKRAMLDAKHEYEREFAGVSDFAPSPPLRAPAPAAEPVVAAAPPAATPAAPAGPGDDTVSGATPATAPQADLNAEEVTRTLASLADLRERGAISAEEYERKKNDLLGRL
jgi:hypothetical protein